MFSVTAASLAQAIAAPYGTNVNWSCRDTGSKQRRPIFFSFFQLFLYLFQKPKHLFKENRQSKLLKVSVASKSAFERFAHVRCCLMQNRVFFAYIVSGEGSANRPKQLRNDAFHDCQNKSVCQKLARSCKK